MTDDAERLFAGTAPYYARYRPSYPAVLFDHLLAHYGLDATTTVVDLGCGTGQVAIPLAARGVPVIAIDPSPEMLAEARRAAVQAGVEPRVRLVTGVGEELPSLVREPVQLVVSAAAFHWMDRERVLAHCDRLVAPDGGVAIIDGAPSVWTAGTPDWARVIVDVIRELLGPERRAGRGTYREPGARHEEVLARSPFSAVTHWQTALTYVRSLDELVGLQLSTSHSAPALLGDRQAAFEARLRQRLREAVPDGRFVEEVRLDAWCARRPGAASP